MGAQMTEFLAPVGFDADVCVSDVNEGVERKCQGKAFPC